MTRNTNGTGFSLKDELFNEFKVTWLAEHFAAADPKFNQKQFVVEVMGRLLDLELKERIVHIATVLESQLDPDFTIASRQIIKALPPELDPNKTDDDFGDFMIAPLGEYVVRNGLSKKHFTTSLQTLKELTKRFSMEDAIRYFINEFPDQTFVTFEKWATDKNYHVRRMVSEGTRLLLPWSGRLVTDIARPLPFLDTLHADPTRYVTRSVANHLNDIAKRKPELVISALTRWHKAKKQQPAELAWMTRHALRTLIKQGNVDALVMLGFRLDPKITVTNTAVNCSTVEVGEALEFSFTVTAQADERLMIDYVVDFVKASGQTKPKVHKLKQLELKKRESVVVSKRHPFRAGATTITYYPGVHTVTLQINGKKYDSFEFELHV